MNVLIVRNSASAQAIDASLFLATYLATQGVMYTLADSSQLDLRESRVEVARVARAAQLAVVLGGDGTILRTASCVGSSGVPILGINFGNLGFLANSGEDGVVPIVAAALSGEMREERRTNLRIDVVCEGESDPFADDEGGAFDEEEFVGGAADSDDAEAASLTSARSFFALNEVVVSRGAMGRIIDFSLGISGAHLADMRGDGLVIASATGSTAYALSAGGPLVTPNVGGLVVVPLAPHTLRSRAIITAENDVVEMDLSANPASREPTLFVDGDRYEFETPVRRVYVRRGATPTTLLRYKNETFYEYASETFF